MPSQLQSPSQRWCGALLVQRFKEHLIRRAEAGAPDYKETLLMTPCDWWPFLRGRTLWLVGDSITQEGYDAAHADPFAVAALLPACILMQLQAPPGLPLCPCECLHLCGGLSRLRSPAGGSCIGNL